MVVHITNPHEGKKTEEIARAMVDQRVFFGWPFLHEGLVKAVSDELFKYEMMTVIPTSPQKVISNPHAPHGVYAWRQQAERSEELYSKKTGVVTGPVQVLLHIRPLKGLKPLESGAFVKDYEGMDKEVEHAVQMCLPEVVSEDPRFLERGAPPLAEEFPEGSKLFFLGEHAYGVPGQVSGTTDTTLAVILAFYPNEKDEVEQFLKVVQDRKEDRYFPSFKAADRLGISGRALSKITSSFMVVNSDNQKTNLGLSLKFEAKALKVIDYSRKQNTKYWEFSEKAIQLIKEYKESFPEVFRSLDKGGDAFTHVDEVFTGNDAEARLRDVKAWLKQKGIRDFEPVSLFCDQLSKETIGDIEKLADDLRQSRAGGTYKKAIVKGIPRQAVLKPAHAVYRLQGQKFNIGDRVIMVQDSGAVPLSAKGVVVGLNSTSMDVVWDNSFISGTTLGNKCSQYRGSTVEFNTCLNLTYKQYVRSTKPDAPAQALNMHAASFRPRNGPRPDVQPAPGQAPVAGFRQAPGPKTIMTNPNRGRGRGAGLGHHLNGAPRGAPPNHLNNGGDRGHFSGGQPTPAPLPYRGRGGFTNGTPYPHGGPVLHSGYRPSDNSHVDRARGGPRGRGFRGRGRGGDGFVNSTISPAANGAP
ncbi:hypothetical protein BDN72DRAFT_773795 [Pluteus cervinus]|uniref:Uncharacterized protein n=1 Tax=Pluteus cervinus TaxID=181527 RepID=A0ACD3AJR3_9AGAR|nr:hypothetical protein BDN72DRAFT_773795 [Pluteus cervinus]